MDPALFTQMLFCKGDNAAKLRRVVLKILTQRLSAFEIDWSAVEPQSDEYFKLCCYVNSPNTRMLFPVIPQKKKALYFGIAGMMHASQIADQYDLFDCSEFIDGVAQSGSMPRSIMQYFPMEEIYELLVRTAIHKQQKLFITVQDWARSFRSDFNSHDLTAHMLCYRINVWYYVHAGLNKPIVRELIFYRKMMNSDRYEEFTQLLSEIDSL